VFIQEERDVHRSGTKDRQNLQLARSASWDLLLDPAYVEDTPLNIRMGSARVAAEARALRYPISHNGSLRMTVTHSQPNQL
jgi:hypothetical protein